MFYDRLKEACEKKGVKMTPTIIECGGSNGIIGAWKKGVVPNGKIIVELAKKLDVTTDYLLGMDEE